MQPYIWPDVNYFRSWVSSPKGLPLEVFVRCHMTSILKVLWTKSPWSTYLWTPPGNSAFWRFKCGNVFKLCDRLIFHFYMGLSHLLFIKCQRKWHQFDDSETQLWSPFIVRSVCTIWSNFYSNGLKCKTTISNNGSNFYRVGYVIWHMPTHYNECVVRDYCH